VPLSLDAHVEDQLFQLLDQIEQAADPELARAKLSARLADGISMVIEAKDLPPTEKQIKYAVAIARELHLELPADVLQLRQAMNNFLEEHADRYRRRRKD
jgi:hypothetical protein